MRSLILAAICLSAAGLAGCDVYTEPEPEPAIYEPGYTVYYQQGYYDGPYWVYRDHHGHWFRERREEHERREAAFRAHREHFGREGHEFHEAHEHHGEIHGGHDHEGHEH